MSITRRDLVKFGGSACLVAGLAAGTAMADEAAGYLVGTSDINFTVETDVLIIGTGIAGLAAGMEPALAGKKVILADKRGNWGGDSLSSCWFMFGSGTKNQLDNGVETTIEQAWEAAAERQVAQWDFPWWPEYAKDKYFAMTEFYDCAQENFGCQWAAPCTMEELPRLGSGVILPAEGIASGYTYVMSPIASKLEELGAEFMFDMKATALIKDAPEGAVIGARFTNLADGSVVDIKAAATILATGCFIDNGEMMNKYLPDWAHYGTLVNGSSMGEGHMMAWAAGAMQHGMDSSIALHYCNLMGDLPNATTWGYWTPMVLVLPNGKRFIQEGQSHDAAQAAVDCGYRQWWVMFDNRAFENRSIATSVKNNVALHEDVYCTAETIEEMAVLMDVPVDALVNTFAEYDGFVDAGEDPLGKTAWLDKLQAPFHALKLNVVRYKTSGGVICNAEGLVIDNDGNGIPGLYACGAVATPGQASVSACASTGYLAGKKAAAL